MSSLVCKKCGYKQYDDETIESYKKDYPNMEIHDIPYICGACENMNNTTRKILVADPEEWQFDVYLFEEEINLEEVSNDIDRYKEEHWETWNLDELQTMIKSKYKVKDILMFDDIACNIIDVTASNEML